MKISTRSRFTTHKIVLIGLMSALVLIFSGFRILIPISVDNAAIQLGNIMCVLSGLLLGPVGGLSCAIGSALYDLTNPMYAPEAWITFINKFFIGFFTGLIAHWHGRKSLSFRWNLSGAIVGSLVYVVLYFCKSWLMGAFVFSLSPGSPMLIFLATKCLTSTINAILAVAVAVPLWEMIRPPLLRARVMMP